MMEIRVKAVLDEHTCAPCKRWDGTILDERHAHTVALACANPNGCRCVTERIEKFRTIVADPPWHYDNRGVRGAAEKHYPTMSVDELRVLPVTSLREENAHLYLWTTNSFLINGVAGIVCEAWGFVPKTLLTWRKPQMGTGFYFRGETEHVVFAVRGSLYLKRKDARNFFECPRGPHSSKPEQFYELVESCSPGPYLELFARRARPGWTSFGNEIGRDLFSGHARTVRLCR